MCVLEKSCRYYTDQVHVCNVRQQRARYDYYFKYQLVQKLWPPI